MVKEFTILSIPVEPEKSVLDVLEGLWKSKRSRRSRWNGQRMHRCLLFGFQYYQKTCPVPNGGYDRFLIILTSRKQPWKYNFVWGFYAYWGLWKSRKLFPFMNFIPSVGWRMSAVKSDSSPTVLHLSPTPLLTTQTDSFTNKKRRKKHLRNKKENLRKRPVKLLVSKIKP